MVITLISYVRCLQPVVLNAAMMRQKTFIIMTYSHEIEKAEADAQAIKSGISGGGIYVQVLPQIEHRLGTRAGEGSRRK